jgi:hypothetical protein
MIFKLGFPSIFAPHRRRRRLSSHNCNPISGWRRISGETSIFNFRNQSPELDLKLFLSLAHPSIKLSLASRLSRSLSLSKPLFHLNPFIPAFTFNNEKKRENL